MRTTPIFLLTIISFLLIETIAAEPRWEIINPRPVAGDIISIDFVDEEVGWLVTDGGLVMKTEDGGESWDDFAVPMLGNGAKGVDFADRELGWILGGLDEELYSIEIVYLTTDGGDSWDTLYVGNRFQPCNITSAQIYQTEIGWAAGTTNINGQILPAVFRYLGEEQWDIVTLPGNANTQINDVHFVGRNSGWVVGQHGYSAYTNDCGRNWHVSDSGTELELTAVSFVNPLNGWAVGGDFETGVLLGSRDGGDSWESQDHPAGARFTAVRAISSTRAVAVSMGWNQTPAVIIRMVDGENWRQVFTTDDYKLLNMAYNGDYHWVCGEDGFLIKTDNGENWNELSTNLLQGSVFDVEFINESIGWFVGTDGAAFKTTDGGSSWNRIPAGINITLLTATFIDEREGWLTGQSSIELHTTDGGAHWQPVDISNVDVNLVEFNGDVGYAAHGQSVSVTHNRGQDWETRHVIQGQQIPAISLSVPSPDIAYIASRGDSLRRTTDGGDTWQAVETPFSLCYGVSFPDQECGWAAGPGRQGGVSVYYTGDSGEHWVELYSFDFTPGCLTFPNRVQGWLSGLPNLLYRTDDGGRTWTDLELGVNRIVRRIEPVDVYKIWICGDGGLVARWGENWLSAPMMRESFPDTPGLLRLYPNPTNGLMNLEMNVNVPGKYCIDLFDVSGRMLQTQRGYFSAPGNNLVPLILNGEPAGTYMIRMETNGQTFYGRATVVK